jgi:beta-mannosidase
MGTLYWQLNDTWPVVSWSSRDYFGRWKALHYAAREAFAPLLLSPVLEGESVRLWGVSDLPDATEGTLRLELLDFGGTILWQAPVPTTLPANGSALLWEAPVAELLGDADPTEVVFVARFERDSGGGGSESGGQTRTPTPRPALLYFRSPRELAMEAPAIRIQVSPTSEGVAITLESDLLAKDVYLSREGVHFPENFFDLLPGRPVTLQLATELSPDEVEEGLRIRTLAEVPREGVEVERSQGNG